MKSQAQSTSDNCKLPESMKKACCETCLLSKAMRDCANCPFNAYRERKEQNNAFMQFAAGYLRNIPNGAR